MGWFGATPGGNNDSDDKESTVFDTLNSKLSEFGIDVDAAAKMAAETTEALPWETGHTVILGVTSVASMILGSKLRHFRTSVLTRKSSVHELSTLGPDSPWLRGRVVSVSDGDTLRFYHLPTRLLHRATLPKGAKMSDITIPVRVCTIDTPETAKFGKPGQAFGEEAKKLLSDSILDKNVQIQVLAKDQYGRAVAEVCFKRFGLFHRYMDQVMLQSGLAEVYQGSGAVYGHKGKEAYLGMQERAQSKKLGIWSDPNRESAAEYKARLKKESSV